MQPVRKNTEVRRIVNALRQKGWRTQDIAREQGVSREQVSRWSCGTQDTTPDRLPALRKLLLEPVPKPPVLHPHRVTGYKPSFLAALSREGLRRALRFLRRQNARPSELNPAAAQYDGLATPASVRAEYRRRGWKVPPPTRWERP